MPPKSILKSQSDRILRFWPFNFTDLQFGYRIRLFRWNGLVFSTDAALVLLFAVLILSLRFRLFPFYYSNLSIADYWGMAVITGLGIAASVIAHEMAHVVVARRMGEIPHGLFLFIFGAGTSVELCAENRWKKTKLYLAGVLLSLVLSVVFVGLAFLSQVNARHEFIIGILFHLGAFNLTLAAFQSLPVLPLDGGRFVLSLISREGQFRPWVITAFYLFGNLIGFAFAAAGGYQIYKNRPVLGAWIAALGLLLLRANYEEYEYLIVKGRLSGHSIRNFMNKSVVTVPLSMTLIEFSRKYLAIYPFKAFPVLSENKLAGIVYRRSLYRVPLWRWKKCRISDVFQPASDDILITSNTDAAAAWSLMVHTGNPRLLVSEGACLSGMVSYGDLLSASIKQPSLDKKISKPGVLRK